MPPKNKKKNSFYFFMKEFQDKEARKGYNISMTQLPNLTHPIWKQMSLAEREPYEEMARQFKNDPSFRGGKLASDGTRVEDNLWEAEEKIRQLNKMKQDVKRYCNSDCITEDQFIESTPKKLFYFMTFNIQCRTDDEIYIPCEVGIVEYSIQEGINREYCKLIHPGHPPTGYAGVAKQLSEEKHEISVFGEECSEKNLRVVFEEIKAFTNPVGNEEYPPIFCEREAIPVTAGCLSWLSERTGRQNVFEVWDAAHLLLELRAGVGNPLPSYAVASDILNKSSFNYHPSTRCEFHEEKDIHCCALAYSKRVCYLISDAVCNLFNIPLTEKHIPTRAVEDKSYTVTLVKEKGHHEVNAVRLDKTYNYYQNTKATEESEDSNEDDSKDDAENKTDNTKSFVPRQPAATCIAEEMNRLQLNITAATLPGHGIGRGIRRK